jgi:hypothetical protein
MSGQFAAHGPLPPFAHPPNSAMLNTAAENSSFFIMIEVFFVKPPGVEMVARSLASSTELFGNIASAQSKGQSFSRL